MLIRDLFVNDVTRDIPPVVYFHEQSPARLAAEVSEYIITGGWPEGHRNHNRVPSGIHEQYVRLLQGIAGELGKSGGPELPNVWISGFYGSGKSSFAKLFGLALGGTRLPDGLALSEALLRRDTSPRADELRQAFKELRQKVEPLAVVFDIGSVARDHEHLHAAALRQVQKSLGYCSSQPLVADFELGLERDGHWRLFEQKALEVLGRPWQEVKDKALAEEDFSAVMAALYPERYTDPMSWITSRAGTHQRAESPEEAVAAIRDMLKFREPGATLFLVVDEVSQYVLSSKDRVDRLRAFATALGSTLKGKGWLLALGQQKLDEVADDSFLVWAKDRFPPKLRIHLAPTNIRDVVHKRLLQKKADGEARLRGLFDQYRDALRLFAYGCDEVTADDFIELYPLLPGQIDLLLQITSALRLRSSRAQGDDQAIRGLLQLLGELFRDQKLAENEVGSLVTLDQIYDIQHTALESDVQASMARLLGQCADGDPLLVRVAKAVALLELLQDNLPTDARLVAQNLYDRLDRGDRVAEVTAALEDLRRRNLLGFSEKHGYKIQSSAAEEWERERRDLVPPREARSELVFEALKDLLAAPEKPRLEGRPFPWAGLFSDERRFERQSLADPRDEAAFWVDFRWPREDRSEATWIRRSAETELFDHLVWLPGNPEEMDDLARELARSKNMVRRFKPRRESLGPARKTLLQQEENRAEDLEALLKAKVAATYLDGMFFFRGRAIRPTEHGTSFAVALSAAATRLLPELYPHFVSTQIQPSELLQLIAPDLSGPSPKFLGPELGILELDAGRYVPSCSGVVPKRIQDYLEKAGGLSGDSLLAYFGGPPFGYTANVVKACVAGLLRFGKLRIQPDGGDEITAVRDAGVKDVFEKDRAFRRASLLPAGEDDIGFQTRARICKFLEDQFGDPVDREDNAIADKVVSHFPREADRLRSVLQRLQRLPASGEPPAGLLRLQEALEHCIRSARQTKATVRLVKRHLESLRDGLQLAQIYDAELTPTALQAVRDAASVAEHQAAQLAEVEGLGGQLAEARERLLEHLGSERPWRDIVALSPDLDVLRAAYLAERRHLLAWQEELAEQARARVRGRDGYSTLTGEEAHRVLRPLAAIVTDTTAEAIAPSLRALRESFELALGRAEEEANGRLDEVLSEGEQPLIVRVDLGLRNREVQSERDVEALLAEIRVRLLEQVRSGARVRLV